MKIEHFILSESPVRDSCLTKHNNLSEYYKLEAQFLLHSKQPVYARQERRFHRQIQGLFFRLPISI